MLGAAVSPTLTWAGRSTMFWTRPMSSRTVPRTTSAGATNLVRELVGAGATRGRRKTLVTWRGWTRGDQDGIFHQVAFEHGAARDFGDQQFLAARIRAADRVHALGVVIDTAFDQEGGALAAGNPLEGQGQWRRADVDSVGVGHQEPRRVVAERPIWSADDVQAVPLPDRSGIR